MVVETKDEIETKIICVDNYTYEATHIFNANAFSDDLKGDVGACITRMVIFGHSVRDACAQVSKDFEGLSRCPRLRWCDAGLGSIPVLR